MQLTGYIFDTNFLLALALTVVLILATLVYLGGLHFMLKGKLWFVPLIILGVLFGGTMLEMDKAFQMSSFGSVNYLLILVGLKTVVMLHGIYYLSVLLGKFVGLKKATISLKENEILIVLVSIAAIIIMNNVHTFAWDLQRSIIISLINLVMVYILVNFVFYLGEIKYFFVYGIPVVLAYGYFYFAQSRYAVETESAFLQMQLGLIVSLLVSAIYFILKIRLEIMDDRETSRKFANVKMDVDNDNNIDNKLNSDSENNLDDVNNTDVEINSEINSNSNNAIDDTEKDLNII